jgi:hypothetical protein
MRTTTTVTRLTQPTRRLGRGWCVLTPVRRPAARTTDHTKQPVATASRDVAPVLAAEPRATYRPTATTATAAPTSRPATAPASDAVAGSAPFGLPVLAELPELAGVLEDLVAADAAALRAVAGLASLLADEQVATVSGVSVEQWLGIVAHHTRMDRRFLLRTARLLHRFPTLHGAVRDLQLSWSQLRGLALALREAPTALDERVDGFLGQLLPHLQGTDPDAVISQVQRAIAEWSAELTPATDEPEARNSLHLQPRLDGTGGRISGELDAVGLAIVDDATAPTRAQLDHPAGTGGARADNLLTRLTHTCHPTNGDATEADEDDPHPGPGGVDADGSAPTPDPGGDAGRAGGALPAVKLLLRCDYTELLDATRTPADLLTRLVGGSLRLTTAAARRLLDHRGVELRTIIVDHGQVLGVGRTSRVPPGWLRDATLAVHSTCTGPLCDRPALGADLDHAQPWQPTHPDGCPVGPMWTTSARCVPPPTGPRSAPAGTHTSTATDGGPGPTPAPACRSPASPPPGDHPPPAHPDLAAHPERGQRRSARTSRLRPGGGCGPGSGSVEVTSLPLHAQQ